MELLPVMRTILRSAGIVGLLVPVLVLAQDPPGDKGRPANAEGFDAYVLLSEATYLPPGKPGNDGSAQAILLKFDLIPDLPKGSVIRFTLDR